MSKQTHREFLLLQLLLSGYEACTSFRYSAMSRNCQQLQPTRVKIARQSVNNWFGCLQMPLYKQKLGCMRQSGSKVLFSPRRFDTYILICSVRVLQQRK